MSCRGGCRKMGIIGLRLGRSTGLGRPSRTEPSNDHFYTTDYQHAQSLPGANPNSSELFSIFLLCKRELLLNSAGEQRIYIIMTATRLIKSIREYTLEFSLTTSQLSIEAKTANDDYMLRTELVNDRLPVSFTNIFDNVADVFEFVRKEQAGSVEIEADSLKFIVKAIKVRQIKVEMQRVAISKQEMLVRKVEKVEKRTASLEGFVELTLPKQTHKMVEDYVKKAIKPLADEIKKFNEKVAHLEEKLKQSEARNRYNPSNPISRMTINHSSAKEPQQKNGKQDEKNPDNKKMDEQTINLSKSDKNQTAIEPAFPQPKVKDFVFDVDQTNKYIEYYTIDKNTNTVIKKKDNQEIIMLYASDPIPPTDRHSIKVRLNQITEGFIWIGLITEAKKAEKYIGEQPGIVQFSLQGNQLLINSKSYPLTFQQFKSGSVIGMQVEIPTRKLRFYRNGRSIAMLKLTLPESMTSTKLFPYIQMVNKGDSVTFL